MADLQAPEKLLRGMTVEARIASGNGVACYELTHKQSGQRFVLKHISLPASEEKLEALLLSGAYADRDEAGRYYQHMAEDLVREIRCNRALSECPNILRFLSYQLIPRENSVGYDLYTITARKQSLQQFRQENAMSHLMALNLGIDICTALEAIHEAGFVFQDLCPGNIFLDEAGRFLLGDFGLAPMQDMQYSSLPEQYLSEYSAPELGGVLTGLNPTIDIYSLGMLLYRIYNGYHAPFEDEQTGVSASEERRRAGEALPAPLYADYELAGILGKACAFDPAERYQTPAELREALSDYMIRNAADDSLIVPPIVSSDEPLLEDLPEDEPEPVRFANVEELDESFKTHFAPDTASLRAVIDAVRKEEAKTAKRAPEAPDTPAETAEPAPEQAHEPAPEELRVNEPDNAPDVKAQMPQLQPDPAVSKKAKKKKQASKPKAEKTPRPTAAERKKARKAKKAAKKRAARKAGKKQRHIGGWIVFGLLALVLAAFLLYCFTPLGHNWYEFDIAVDRLEVVETTNDAITVEINSNAEPGLLTASCQDAYGNAFSQPVNGESVTFDGLTPGTMYTINLSLSGFHRLSGATSATAATEAQTEILTFTATAAPEQGAASLSLVVKEGASEPEAWLVSIETPDEDTRSETFSGHSAMIGGLTVGKEYTFRLLDPDGYTLTGQREAVYTPLPVVTAEDLQLTGLLDGTATLSWRCTSQLPEAWTVSCEGPDGEPVEQRFEETEREAEADGSYLCTAELHDVEIGKAYLFRVGADGMFQSLSVTLDEDAPYIAAFDAAVEDGAIRLRWDSAYKPEGGWILRILPDGSEEAALPQVVLTENSYTLEYNTDDEVPTLLPNTNYRFELSTGSGEPLFGYTSAETRSAEAGAFTDLRIDIMTNYTGLYLTPEGDDWDYETLTRRQRQTSFRPGDSIEIMLRNRTGVESSDMDVDVLLVLRDEDGKLVSYDMSRLNWNEMWGNRHWVLHLPHTPTEPGRYTVEIYVNYARMVTAEPLTFTITA